MNEVNDPRLKTYGDVFQDYAKETIGVAESIVGIVTSLQCSCQNDPGAKELEVEFTAIRLQLFKMSQRCLELATEAIMGHRANPKVRILPPTPGCNPLIDMMQKMEDDRLENHDDDV